MPTQEGWTIPRSVKRPPPDLDYLDDLSVEELWEKVSEWCNPDIPAVGSSCGPSSTRSVLCSGSYSVTLSHPAICEECSESFEELGVYTVAYESEFVSSVRRLCDSCGKKWTRLVRKRWKRLLAI